jgi:D-xylose transport system substrate-binding protein
MLKNVKFLLVTILCALLLSSCKNNDSIKIALMLNNTRVARWQKDKAYFLEETKRLGCQGIVVDADLNDQVQFAQAQDLIKQGVKVLLIAAVNSTTGAAIVRLARENGVKTISYDGVINNCPLDYIIAFEDKKIGKLMAEYALSKAKSGNYMIIGGDKTNANSVQIREGEEEALTPYLKNGSIKITYTSYTEGWATDEAYMTMKKILELSDESRPSAILVSNDDMAQGVITAYEQENIPLPIITGQDASLKGCRNIMQGKQSMTVYKPFKKLAAKAAEVAYKIAKGEKIDGIATTVLNGESDVPLINIDILAVDKTNMESTLIKDGLQTREDIMK